jgi:hypothetical protein
VPGVWYARYADARWSAPEQILAGAPINWRWSGSVVGLGDDLVVAAPAFDGNWDGIMATRLTQGQWASARFPSASDFPPTSLALVIEDSQAVAFYPGYGPTNVAGTRAVYSRRWRRGRDWTNAALVQVVTTGLLIPRVDAVRSADGTYHVFWTHRPGGASDVVHHTSSRDLIAWRTPDALTIGGALHDFTIAAEGPADVRFVARTTAHSGLATTTWTAEGPGPLHELSFVIPATPPTLTAFGRDTLVLTWGTVWLKPESDSALSIGLVTVHSRSVRSCR